MQLFDKTKWAMAARHNNNSLGWAYSSYNETKRLGADDKKWSINRLAKETIDNLKPFVIYALN